MIVIDTSALMAIILREPEAAACLAAIEAEQDVLISAGTLTEALIVASRRNIGPEMERLVDALGLEILSLTSASALGAADAYRKWGKGFHAAGLNFGDCFAYQAAKDRQCRLLFVGEDFTRTDLESAIA